MAEPSAPFLLSPARLDQLPDEVRRPDYRFAEHGVGVVHLGLGAFHRAHQAIYLDDLMARKGGNWRSLGVSMRSPSVRERLRPQNGVYCVAERSPEREELRVSGALADILYLAEEHDAVLEALAAPATRIVTLTVTEKGYGGDAEGGIDPADLDLAHDLLHPERPRSAVGLIVEGLARRRARGLDPFTAISCDNLPANGVRLARLVITLAERRDPALADWIARVARFPSSMVDRIVPATTSDDLARFERATGFHDAGLVVTEPFRQWVVEDSFVGERPELEAVGVELVREVGPYEAAKLRLLNGSHSAMAYLGLLAGYDHVHEVMADPLLTAFIEQLMAAELAPTLSPTPGFDLDIYQTILLRRFRNAALPHKTRQIAADGTLKLPGRIIAPLIERLRAGLSAPGLTLVAAAWMRHMLGRDPQGGRYEVADPYASALQAIWWRCGDPDAVASALLDIDRVFGPDLRDHSGFRRDLSAALRRLIERGPRAAMRHVLERREAAAQQVEGDPV